MKNQRQQVNSYIAHFYEDMLPFHSMISKLQLYADIETAGLLASSLHQF